jgi:mono/diheme cytochrome c family protein
MLRLKLSLSACALLLFALACSSNTTTETVTNTGRAANANAANANAATANAAASPAPPDSLAAARTTYNNACVKCHKENGEGGAVDVDGEKIRVPSFKGGHALKHTDAEYAKQITNGGEGMPKFKDRLTPEQIDGLVRLIRADFQSGVGGASNSNAGAH